LTRGHGGTIKGAEAQGEKKEGRIGKMPDKVKGGGQEWRNPAPLAKGTTLKV